MYLKLKGGTYTSLLTEANAHGMSLAAYINRLLEIKLIQQGCTDGTARIERAGHDGQSQRMG